MIDDEYFMNIALLEGEKAKNKGEIPVGAVIVKDGKIISRGQNKKEKTNLAIMHAEVDAIIKASKKLGDWRLDDCELYVTIEPCVMCAGGILASRIKRVIFGSTDDKYGGETVFKVFTKGANNWKCQVTSGVLEEKCRKQMTGFFIERRK